MPRRLAQAKQGKTFLRRRAARIRSVRDAARENPAARTAQRLRRLLTTRFLDAVRAHGSGRTRALVAWAEATVKSHAQARSSQAGRRKRAQRVIGRVETVRRQTASDGGQTNTPQVRLDPQGLKLQLR